MDEYKLLSKAAIPFTKTSVVSPSFVRLAVVHVRLIFVGNVVSLRDVVGDPHLLSYVCQPGM